MEISKIHKYTFCFVLSLIVGVTLQYFDSAGRAYLSTESLQKLTELNKKYNVSAIEAVTTGDEVDAIQQNHFTSLLQTSVIGFDNQAPTQEGSKKLLFKLKAQDDSIDNIMALHLPGSADNLQQIAEEYKQNVDEIDFIEPDYEISINSDDIHNGEDFVSILENVSNENTAQTLDGSLDTPGLTVAVIDTGADILHPVLRAHRWAKGDELRNNDQDDDNNGLTDDTYGWDFINSNKRVYVDNSGHGTHVSGIIAGAVPSTKIMPIKVIEEKKGNLSNVIRGIKYATENKADIINFSIGTTEESKSLKTAIDYAAKKGITMIAAAGNSGDSTPYYPAAYKQVISVGATNSNGERLSKSNYGNWVNVFAPGQNVLSSSPGNKYEYKSGTSQAAAVVTAEVTKIKNSQTYVTNVGLINQLKAIFSNE